MKMNKKNSEEPKFKLLKIEQGKYFVKLPNVEVPVALDKYLYDRWIRENEVVMMSSRTDKAS